GLRSVEGGDGLTTDARRPTLLHWRGDSAEPSRRRSSVFGRRSSVPVLRRRYVGYSPLVPVPAVESVEIKSPESGADVADDDEAIGVPDINPVGAVLVGGRRAPACVGWSI